MPLQSCAANATAAALALLAAKNRQNVAPSRLFLYYNARLREGGHDHDTGTSIRSAIKAGAHPGACEETVWPYNPASADTEPPKAAYDEITVVATSYYRLPQLLRAIRSCIAEGFPVIFGLSAYVDAVAHAQTSGVLPVPGGNDRYMGGHAVLAVGYDDASETICALNSLGDAWARAAI